mmetsp:Transcript_25146/g.24609  ORF Transcript_25146/g.24609 Transcript_25146/m.24609 type:complete len:102 (-) Transcript_25146:33-338(-)
MVTFSDKGKSKSHFLVLQKVPSDSVYVMSKQPFSIIDAHSTYVKAGNGKKEVEKLDSERKGGFLERLLEILQSEENQMNQQIVDFVVNSGVEDSFLLFVQI